MDFIFDCVDHSKLWKILKVTGLSDHFTFHLWNLMQVKKQQLELDMEQQTESKLEKEYMSPCLFNLYAEYVMQNARLDEAQAGIEIDRRTINDLRYVDHITLMAESDEEVKKLLINVIVKKLTSNSTFRKLRSWHPVHNFIENRRRNNGNSVKLYFLGLQNNCRWWLQS